MVKTGFYLYERGWPGLNGSAGGGDVTPPPLSAILDFYLTFGAKIDDFPKNISVNHSLLIKILNVYNFYCQKILLK